jgi:hypothetical protein
MKRSAFQASVKYAWTPAILDFAAAFMLSRNPGKCRWKGVVFAAVCLPFGGQGVCRRTSDRIDPVRARR